MLTPTENDQRRLVTIEQAEADYFTELDETFTQEDFKRLSESKAKQLQKPFGYNNSEWESLKDQIQLGDELWEYCTSQSSWNQLSGRAGYELVRCGKVVAHILSCMN